MDRRINKLCVTGAGGGIGAAISEHFAAEGDRGVVTDKDTDAARTVAYRIGGEARELNVSLEGHWAALAEDFPAIDVLVNNAGITGFEAGPAAHDPEHASLEDWRAVRRVNLDATFLGCRYAIGATRGSGKGAIVNISSRSGLVGIPAAAAYASSKTAVRNHTMSVALYCAGEGLAIRCNSVHPPRS